MSRGPFFRAMLLAVVLAAAVLGWWLFEARLNAAAVETTVGELGWLAPLMFVGGFALATILFFPGSVFGLAGGILFGPLWGTVWNLAGGTFGATVAFLFARFVAGDWIAARAQSRLKIVLAGVEAEGWRFVALTRLVPLVPFNLLNYALGLTRIPLSQYVLATAVCMVPGTAAYAWLGYAGRAAIGGNGDALRYGALALAALALVVFLPRLIRRLRPQSQAFVAATLAAARLKSRLDEKNDLLVLDVRPATDYAGGHVPGAKNIPLETLAQRFAELELWREKPVALVCRTNRRSGEAARWLRERGFTDVLLVGDGMLAWERQGFPLEKAREPTF